MKSKIFIIGAGIGLAALLTACGGGTQYEQDFEVVAADETTVTGFAAKTEQVLMSAPEVDIQLDRVEGDPVDAPQASTAPQDVVLGTGEDMLNVNIDASTEAAAVSNIRVFNPQQIRAAYKMPELPKDPKGWAELTAEQRADFGAGQTIYIIAAYDAPDLAKDLETFNSTFGLPSCKPLVIPTRFAKLKAADPAAGCELAVVRTRIGRTMTTNAPAYVSNWAIEQTLDVQWAHATAPLARIVVISTVNSFANSLMSAVMLATDFGPGTVSMSFVASENTWVNSYETLMPKGQGMNLVAASGDYGSQSNWPASSPSVVAVGGTTLKYNGSGEREETLWRKSGGSYSAYFDIPEYQDSLNVPYWGNTTSRAKKPNTRARSVGDVSFNADPTSGQYVVFTPKGKAQRWYSYGGTSIGTPQWAGIFAVVNAQRALEGRGPVDTFHESLYNGSYAEGFNDVNNGANGSCLWCSTSVGYDTPSGWGTPNVDTLMPLMVNR